MFPEVVDKSPASRGFDRAGFEHQTGGELRSIMQRPPDA